MLTGVVGVPFARVAGTNMHAMICSHLLESASKLPLIHCGGVSLYTCESGVNRGARGG